MNSERSTPEAWGRHLAKALRSIRVARGLTTAQMAASVGLDRRNYANFEAGKGRLNVARVMAFAEAADSDPWGLLVGALIGAPNLALETADNKMLVAFFILLAEFETQFGQRVRTLETTEIIAAFRQAFRLLETSLAEKQARLPNEWLREGAARIGLASAEPRKKSDPS